MMPDEILYQSRDVKLFRRQAPDRSEPLLCKQLLSSHAIDKVRHEKTILERLVQVDGVLPAADVAVSADTIALQDRACILLKQKWPGQIPDVLHLLDFAIALTRILAAIHERGIVHKNLHPFNILLAGPAREPAIVDFHLATSFAQEQHGFIHQDEILGTLAYIAPEQTGRTGRTVDQRTDLYALGATLYELATGHPPFVEQDPLRLIRHHLVTLPRAPVEQNPGLPPLLSDILLRLLEKEPDRRYQSAQGLAHDLTRVREEIALGRLPAFPLGERDFAWRLLPPSRLVGREAELQALHRHFKTALQGDGRGLLVAGAPGVGKTALVNELRTIVTAKNGWFVAGKFDQYRPDVVSGGAISQAMTALLRLLLAEPENQLAQQRSRILEVLGPNSSLVTTLLPEFAALLGPQPRFPITDSGEAMRRWYQAGSAFLRAIVSASRPLVIVLDDLQWAGQNAMGFIDAILSDAGLSGLMLVGCYREADVDAAPPLASMLLRWQRLDAMPPVLHLHNLPPTDLSTLLADMLRLPGARAAELAKVIGERTGGNPYDTVEFINALRHDGLLLPREEGWQWDEKSISQYIGHGNVVELLSARVDRLPDQTRALLDIMACLGGEVSFPLLEAASDLPLALLETQLLPALEDGLLMMEHEGKKRILRFRHDRVQQTVYARQEEQARRARHLRLGRRLGARPGYQAIAAEQYLPAAAALTEEHECRSAIELFRSAAANARLINYAAAERFIAAALDLCGRINAATDEDLLTQLRMDHHAALYSLGRLDDADAVYQMLESRCVEPMRLVNAACVQISGLAVRGRQRDAVNLGLGLLRQFGINVPEDNFAAEVERRMHEVYAGIEAATAQGRWDQSPLQDERVLAIARLINQTMTPAFLCESVINAWLLIEAHSLLAGTGPSAPMVVILGRTGFATIAEKQDYRIAWLAAGSALVLGQRYGYEPETSWAHYAMSRIAQHWFEPLENCLAHALRAREGMLQAGDLQMACFTYFAALGVFFDCSPTIDNCASENASAYAFASRTGNEHGIGTCRVYQHLLDTLRDRAGVSAGFLDRAFDEDAFLKSLGSNWMAVSYFHLHRALAALIFGDIPGLVRHAAAAMPLRQGICGFYVVSFAHLLQALALAQRLRLESPQADARRGLLLELDDCREWLAQRAADAPGNFFHLLLLVDAERAWAVGDDETASSSFDQALREAQSRQRPWHRALITERAAVFHLARGRHYIGRHLLIEARDLYHAWGASAKVRQLERAHRIGPTGATAPADHSLLQTSVSADTIDLLAILRASQSLSSSTGLAQLKTQVSELLGAMTGATSVSIVLRQASQSTWFLLAADTGSGSGAASIQLMPVTDKEAASLLPLSAFHYVLRTGEPLLVADATQDDRFRRDACLTALAHCSLLGVPIVHQGALCAVLLLENRHSRSAFTADRLDTVKLIAGQFAVSLENALLYEKLEQRVAQRTRELREAQAELISSARHAGMAEIATNVLHNVGNVLNSVNVCVDDLAGKVQASEVSALDRAVSLLESHSNEWDSFLTQHEKGKLLPGFLRELADALLDERQALLAEMADLRKSVDHIKDIVATQQSYAGTVSVIEPTRVAELVEDALRMNGDSLTRHHITIAKEYGDVPVLELDKHRVLMILVNLLSNAKNAMNMVTERPHQITLSIELTPERRLRISVRDNGEGILPENLTRIFSHGFTTRKDGHGFGLHSCILAAKEMGGSLTAHSEGLGKGASFTLELPAQLAG